MSESPLHRLCDLVGVLPDYHDIWGNRHETTDKSRRALLEAMDIQAGSKATAEAAIRSWGQRHWHQALPAVQVVTAGAPMAVLVRLPVHAAGQVHQWRIAYESGDSREADFLPGDLKEVESHVLNGEPMLAFDLVLPACEVTGYHRLELLCDGDLLGDMSLIICPAACYQPPALRDGNRVWGMAVQLYGVRSQRNWGIGDYGDLRHVMEWAAQAGAGLVGVNPLHALFPHNPQHGSPYSPSSRQFFNVLHVAVEDVPELMECEEARSLVQAPEFQAQLRALRASPMVDYTGVGQAKYRILEILYRHFRAQHLANDTSRARDFLDFQAAGGEDLHCFSLYHALQEHFFQQDWALWGWPVWPAAYQDPDAPEVRAFAAANPERVEWITWLQWLAEQQLATVGQRSFELGLGVGLYQDLAVGVDKGGAETWINRHLYALDARVGCPPDDFNPTGQDWGLPPWVPQRLRDAAYAPFIAMLRANMKYAGALRIDHVMSMMRLFWVPPGLSGKEGAYVTYPLRDLLGILALESQRNQCLVVGEDLGTVPDAVRTALHDMGVLSYRLFYFEREHDGSFRAPAGYPEQALVAASTHDLATLAGFWKGIDLDVRTALDLYPSEALRASLIIGRADDRARILLALEKEGLLPEGTGVHPVNVHEMTPALARAIHRYLARSPAKIALVQAEDMLGELEQANLPGTTDQHPNWRRKLSLNLEEWPDDPRMRAMAEAMVEERGRAVSPPETVPFPLRPVQAPLATYRLQLNKDFTFRDAQALVPYLAELGISHVYCSPYLKARPGSPHGYDIVDHNAINPEIGTEADLEAFCATLAEHGMGHILDMVPNHMGIMGADNGWWLDVLEHGEASAYADHFDIDWNPVKPSLRGKVLVPVLGDHYGNVLERGELKLAFDAEKGEFSLWYWQHRFPIDPREYPRILTHRLDVLGERLGAEHPYFLEFQTLAGGFSHLSARDDDDPAKRIERSRDQAIHKQHLAGLHARSPDIQQFLQENLDGFNGVEGDPASFDLLNGLIDAQAWRLAFWRVASDEINYRRFFDINDLAALRMEREEVFRATHQLVLQLLHRGWLSGLRIDHSDGLFDPSVYFERLQHLHAEARPSSTHGLYVVVEKILALHERLRPEWAISGTTGYEAANLIGGLFIDADAAAPMERVFRAFCREKRDFEEILCESKRIIMKSALASELNVLATRLSRIAEMDRSTRDYTLNSLRTTLADVVAAFPVYRTYLSDTDLTEDDTRQVEWACAVARKRSQVADASIYDFVRDVLLGSIAEGKNASYREVVINFAMRFQQFSSPVMAKGMEDTTFYRYFPLASVNEVGGEPTRFGIGVAGFHRANQERARSHPHSMLASSTHDTKRGEDVRARIDVLSEMPDEWQRSLNRWHRMNRARLGHFEGVLVPSRRDEYLLYQTLIGTWPDIATESPEFEGYVERITAYMIKAVREAKDWSSWVNPNPDYENQLRNFVASALNAETGRRFLAEFAPFAANIAHFGRINGLAQTALKLTLPGVPDTYQGCELWNLSLVDPDNRRPVDYAARGQRLADLRALEQTQGSRTLAGDLLADAPSGAIKLYLTWKLLELHRRLPALFQQGGYHPLGVSGEQEQHVCAFARSHARDALVVAVPRLPYRLLAGEPAWPIGSVWGDTRLSLPNGHAAWRNLFTGATIASRREGDEAHALLRECLADFPLAVLIPA